MQWAAHCLPRPPGRGSALCTTAAINRDPNAALTVSFGRPVVVDEIRLTLRADFPHDSWWTEATVRFDDGGSEILSLLKTAEQQAFAISPRTVTALRKD